MRSSDLQSLLLSCGLLESLSLDCCPLSSLSVRQELYKLRHLSVRKCAVGTLQLQAPNLATFEFEDCPTQIVLNESSKLSQATLMFKSSSYSRCCDPTDYILTELPTVLPHVHKIFLHMVFEYKVQQKYSKAQGTFLNLKHLNLNIDILDNNEDISWQAALINLLELAPLLEELELHMDSSKFGIPDRTVTAAPGRHLRVVHITGFSDFEGIPELTLYILENATALERMVVDPVVWMDIGYPYTGKFCSASKTDSSEARSLLPKGQLPEREFAKKLLDKEDFRHIVTIV